MKFGDILKNLMIEENKTQAEVAKEIGYTQRAVSKWVNNQAEPTETAIANCARLFNVSTDYLLGFEEGFSGTIPPDSALKEKVAAWMGESLTPAERELIKKYRSISPDLQKMLFEILGTWTGEPVTETTKK